jgi:hypothetical protein
MDFGVVRHQIPEWIWVRAISLKIDDPRAFRDPAEYLKRRDLSRKLELLLRETNLDMPITCERPPLWKNSGSAGLSRRKKGEMSGLRVRRAGSLSRFAGI